jgi:uncharacterized protein (DUF433 family)
MEDRYYRNRCRPAKINRIDQETSMLIPWPDYLPEIDGERRFAGTRVGILEILHFYNTQAYSAEMLALEFPSIDLAIIHKFLGFYLENQREIDEVVAAQQAELDALRAASPHHVSLDALRRRVTQQPHSAQV